MVPSRAAPRRNVHNFLFALSHLPFMVSQLRRLFEVDILSHVETVGCTNDGGGAKVIVRSGEIDDGIGGSPKVLSAMSFDTKGVMEGPMTSDTSLRQQKWKMASSLNALTLNTSTITP